MKDIKHKEKNKATVIAAAGAIVGTLDIGAALVLTSFRGGDPLSLFQFIASGLFGEVAFSGGWLYGMYGLILHYGIATLWTIVFFVLADRISVMRREPLLTGILFGTMVWLVMNLIVIPLSNTPRVPFRWDGAVIGAFVIILAIGLPLALISQRLDRPNGSAGA